MTEAPNPGQQEDESRSSGDRAGSTREGAPGALRRAGWAVQERVLWKGGDALRAVGGALKWPFENAAWALRSRVAWPLADSFERSGPATRRALAGVGVAVLALLGAGGAYIVNQDSGSEPAGPPRVVVPTPAPVAAVVPRRVPKHAHHEKVLKGAAPTFAPENDAAKSGVPAGQDAVPATPAQGDSASSASSGSQSSKGSAKAGPAPLKVAHRFAGAFVSYEVGKSTRQVRKVFRKTATQPLAESLAKRPPRQPATVKVPRARVLNVVPGPRRGASVSVSVSLLRVGATSELRLQLQQVQDQWLVSDVRG